MGEKCNCEQKLSCLGLAEDPNRINALSAFQVTIFEEANPPKTNGVPIPCHRFDHRIHTVVFDTMGISATKAFGRIQFTSQWLWEVL